MIRLWLRWCSEDDDNEHCAADDSSKIMGNQDEDTDIEMAYPHGV